MIDFACKKFDLNEIIRCGLGISKTEYKVFKLFLSSKNKFFETSEVQRMLKVDLSTVQRAVKKLYNLSILERGQTNLSGGGYLFSYKIKNKENIKSAILKIINSWNERVISEFDNW